MWTKENRGHHDRNRLPYAGDLTGEEWALMEPLIGQPGAAAANARSPKAANDLMDAPSADWSSGKVTIHPCSDGVAACRNQSEETGHGR